jgi:hypothetical protein
MFFLSTPSQVASRQGARVHGRFGPDPGRRGFGTPNGHCTSHFVPRSPRRTARRKSSTHWPWRSVQRDESTSRSVYSIERWRSRRSRATGSWPGKSRRVVGDTVQWSRDRLPDEWQSRVARTAVSRASTRRRHVAMGS